MAKAKSSAKPDKAQAEAKLRDGMPKVKDLVPVVPPDTTMPKENNISDASRVFGSGKFRASDGQPLPQGHTRPLETNKVRARAGAENQPVSRVQWVPVERLVSNGYNPNHVFSPELQLLKTSILEDGWTMPIVVRSTFEVVDGFHRWSLARLDPDIRALTNGLVPVVVMDPADPMHQMMSTIRHNRARGSHGIMKMGEIVRDLLLHGCSVAEICDRLGMESDEVERLRDLKGSPGVHGKESFGRGWVPAPPRVGFGDKLSAVKGRRNPATAPESAPDDDEPLPPGDEMGTRY